MCNRGYFSVFDAQYPNYKAKTLKFLFLFSMLIAHQYYSSSSHHCNISCLSRFRNVPLSQNNKKKRQVNKVISSQTPAPLTLLTNFTFKGGIILCNLLYRTCLIGLNHKCNTSVGLNFQTVKAALHYVEAPWSSGKSSLAIAQKVAVSREFEARLRHAAT